MRNVKHFMVMVLVAEWKILSSHNKASNFDDLNCLLPTSQPSEDARLARRQRIVPREEWRMRKNSRSSSESVKSCKV